MWCNNVLSSVLGSVLYTVRKSAQVVLVLLAGQYSLGLGGEMRCDNLGRMASGLFTAKPWPVANLAFPWTGPGSGVVVYGTGSKSGFMRTEGRSRSRSRQRKE